MPPAYYPDSFLGVGGNTYYTDFPHIGGDDDDESKLLPNKTRLWSPRNLATNGVAWWDASDPYTITLSGLGTVSGWTSKLGSAVVSQQVALNQPAYKLAQINSHNTVNGSNQTSFLVGGNVSVSIQNCGFASFFNMPTSSGGAEIVGSDPAGQHRLDVAVNGVSGTFFYFAGNGNQSVGPNLFNAGHIGVLYISSGTVTPRIDGTAFATSTCPSNTTTSIGIGSFAQSNVGTFNGDIGDVLYMASPSLNQITKAEGYLAWKWGIVANLPGGHPYKTRPPFVSDPN